MFKKIAIAPIRVYQWMIRPLFPNTCVFYHHDKQSCSEYTVATIQVRGVTRGIFLGIYRILRCHPWQRNFNDPQ